MGYTFLCKINFTALFLFLFLKGITQPYVDIVNSSFQSLTTKYKGPAQTGNQTNNYFLNITLPVRIDSQNTFILRIYGEQLDSKILNTNLPLAERIYSLNSLLMPIGIQHETKNKKWKFIGLLMPKLSSDFKKQISSYDMQLGGYGLATYTINQKLKIKAGLFYNREFFGNFFVPLFAIDWVVSDRLQMYGVLPTTYRIEYAFLKQKLYGGFAFKSYTRSYRIGDANHDYVKNAELQAKLFLDFYIKKRYVLFAEFGRTLNYSPLAYLYGTKTEIADPIYSKIQDAFFFHIGFAYRIRSDFK